ncbi:MAG: hypothetical protein VB055_01585 [Oscillospiraceae bacterium]|nr:hypothetical protein [Oscillospiraceae bacterium]
MEHQEEHLPPQEDYRQVRKANGSLAIRILAMFYVFYMLFSLVKLYLAGGEGAPSLSLLIAGIVLLGGGGIGVGIFALRLYRQARANAKKPPEEEAQPGESQSGE